MAVAEAQVLVHNALGIHLRPAGMISKAAISFRSKIAIIRGEEEANARSIVALTMMGARVGTPLTIRAEGPDAELAVRVIGQLFAEKFGED